jgi:general stress protein 26
LYINDTILYMEQRHIDSAKVILEKIHYINIATVNEDGSPWNTPVSASHDEQLNFYWGSSPDSVHSQNIREMAECLSLSTIQLRLRELVRAYT